MGLDRINVHGENWLRFTDGELLLIRVLAGVRAEELKNLDAREAKKNPRLVEEIRDLLPMYESIVRKIGEPTS